MTLPNIKSCNYLCTYLYTLLLALISALDFRSKSTISTWLFSTAKCSEDDPFCTDMILTATALHN